MPADPRDPELERQQRFQEDRKKDPRRPSSRVKVPQEAAPAPSGRRWLLPGVTVALAVLLLFLFIGRDGGPPPGIRFQIDGSPGSYRKADAAGSPVNEWVEGEEISVPGTGDIVLRGSDRLSIALRSEGRLRLVRARGSAIEIRQESGEAVYEFEPGGPGTLRIALARGALPAGEDTGRMPRPPGNDSGMLHQPRRLADASRGLREPGGWPWSSPSQSLVKFDTNRCQRHHHTTLRE